MEMFKYKNSNKRIRDILCKSLFVMRFEIKLKTPSGTVLHDKINTLRSIDENWEFLIDLE